MHILKVDKDNSKKRLDVYLAEVLPDVPSRTFIQKLIDTGNVTVNEKIVKPHYKILEGDDIHVIIPKDFQSPQYIEPEKIELDVFYEDESLLIINKPSGMLVHPATGRYSGTLVNALLHLKIDLSDVNTQIRPGIVHRLDEETSGLIVIAKDNISHARLARQFERKEIQKKYVALVEGSVEFDEGLIKAPIARHKYQRDKKAVEFDGSGKDSITYYKVIKRRNNVTLVALFPKTGRTHQLRVHMRHLGHPILGDEKYGKKSTFPRLALHAQSIGFKHPIKKYFMEFSSPVPAEFLKKVS